MALAVWVLAGAGWCQPADAQDWWARAAESRTRYYNLKTDLPEDQASEIAEHLDRTYACYANLFRGLRLRRGARLDVYVFASQEDYAQVLRDHFKDDATGSAGKCITRGDVISLVAWRGDQRLKRLKQVLQHEGFHQFASNFFPRLPTWANEGLAEVFERGVIVGDRIVLGEVSRTDVLRMRQAKERSQFRSVGDLLTVGSAEWNHQVRVGEAGPNYLQAWCLVHCLLYAEEGKYQPGLVQFLRGINSGLEWKDSFVAAFGVPDFEAMDEVWLRYIDTLYPMDYETTITRMEFLAAGYMHLREQEIYPLNMEELQAQLVAAEFAHEVTLDGQVVRLVAADAKNFSIPHADAWSPTPVFEWVNRNGEAVEIESDITDSAARKKQAPRPLKLRTQNFSPLDFEISWKRSARSPGGYTPVFVAD